MQTSIVKNNKELVPNLKIRKDILDFEKELSKVPSAVFGDSDLCPLKHSFSDGIYVREMSVPKGIVLTGKIHKHEHPYFVLKGEVTIVTEHEGKKVIKAPCSMISNRGTKRVIIANEDSVLVTVHHNPDNIKDLKKLENLIVSENYVDYENYLNQKTINTHTTNCGLESLKNLTSLKNISVRTIIDMAKDNGVELYPYKVTIDELESIPLPAIVHSKNHFEYVSKIEDLSYDKEYSGNVLLTKKSDYKKIKNSELQQIKGETFILVSAGTLTTLGVAVISGGSAITAASIKAASDSKTKCGSDCRAKCKNETSWLLGGRKDCKKRCKDQCVTALSPEQQKREREQLAREEKDEKNANTLYIIGGILFAIALGLVIYMAVKKK